MHSKLIVAWLDAWIPKLGAFSLIFTLCALLTGCAEFADNDSYQSQVSAWIPTSVPGVMFQVNQHGRATTEYKHYCIIKNFSGKHIEITGLVTRYQNSTFIDLKQPGAFHAALYPGQHTMVGPDEYHLSVADGGGYIARGSDWINTVYVHVRLVD
jgi:hypothetical protein